MATLITFSNNNSKVYLYAFLKPMHKKRLFKNIYIKHKLNKVGVVMHILSHILKVMLLTCVVSELAQKTTKPHNLLKSNQPSLNFTAVSCRKRRIDFL